MVETFYTDGGVLPRAALAEVYPFFADVSLHALSGSSWFQLVLFLILIGAAIGLIFGYRIRLMGIIAIVLLASLQARNPLVLSGGDTILVVLLFIGLFLPLDSRWSLTPTKQPSSETTNTATATVLLFIVMIYFTNGLLKLRSEAWMQGDAIAQIGQIQRYWTDVGLLVIELDPILGIINWTWVALLLLSPLLLVSGGLGRTIIAGGLLAAQAGMAITLWIGVFPLVLFTAVLLFLPAPVWDRFGTTCVRPMERWFGSHLQPQFPSIALGVSPPNIGVASSWSWLRPATRRRKQLVSVVLIVLLIGLTSWQLMGTGLAPAPTPELTGEVANANWAMFASPPSANTWHVLDTERLDGERIDALRGDDVTITEPPDAVETADSWLWLRYSRQLRHGDERLFEPLADFGCEAVDGATAIEILRIDQSIDPTGANHEPTVYMRYETSC